MVHAGRLPRMPRTQQRAEHTHSSDAQLLCCIRWFSPSVVFTKFPAEPALLGRFSLVTCPVISLFQHWGYQSGSERVSPLTCFSSSYFRYVPATYQRHISYQRPILRTV